MVVLSGRPAAVLNSSVAEHSDFDPQLHLAVRRPGDPTAALVQNDMTYDDVEVVCSFLLIFLKVSNFFYKKIFEIKCNFTSSLASFTSFGVVLPIDVMVEMLAPLALVDGNKKTPKGW